ncbi:MAG: LysM peptidoglycan-binding domain-containing protein [Clostridia bacterium]|nr:LysM peptidoglycan-binding domain-containing protein [Clostridia bacterium]
MEIYVVESGDTVFSISEKFGVTPDSIIYNNMLPSNQPLVVGQALVILFPDVIHTVRSGETLIGIANLYNVSLTTLYQNNIRLSGRQIIYPGDTVIISYRGEKIRSIEVNAYAYPGINRTLLRRTLPYLTYLTPFTYGFNEDGSLVDLSDGSLISISKEYETQPLMHLSTLTNEGNFSNELASEVLNSPTLQATLIDNVLRTMREKGYYGLDIDFEFVFPEEAPLYASFVENAARRLNPYGYEVIVALAPKTSATQRGLLYEGHDYSAIGRGVNGVLLMTYEWGYTYGPPLAVAPLPNVRSVVEYALTEIPAEKLFLGMPNYGYDWTLPFVQGTSRAISISSQQAIATAARYGAEIMYDEYSQTPFFDYIDENGRQHQVWFEDARSIREKLALVSEYNLRGVGYWNAMRDFPQNWLVLNALYEIEKRG